MDAAPRRENTGAVVAMTPGDALLILAGLIALFALMGVIDAALGHREVRRARRRNQARPWR